MIVAPVVIVILLAYKAYTMASVAGAIMLAVLLVRKFSPAGQKKIDRALGLFAHAVGIVVGNILLAPVFFIGITVARLMSRLTGSDPLRLRCGESPTFWLPSDYESRRKRYGKGMFCTEHLSQGGLSLMALAVLAVLLVTVAVVGLRIYGLRDAILYVEDVETGYYPKPNQRVRHPGRIITINNHGMRAPDLTEHKKPGHFRILMLGDSTLAGTRVSNDELYSSLLEKKLNEAAGAPVFEAMNMGVNAWGPYHELGYVKKFGSFEADLAIICGPVTNCYRPLFGLDRLPHQPANRPPRLALEHVFYQLVWQYRQSVLGRAPWELRDDTVAIQGNNGVEAYGELAEVLQKDGAEVIVEMLATKMVVLGLTEQDADPLFEKVKQRVGQLGIFANRAGPIFKGVAPAKELYHDAVHFDRLGHRLYADYLFEQLRQHSPRIKKALDHS
jgi:lysophospholipase L1-like esterase